MGHPDTLLAKSVLDFVIVLIFSSAMGVGVLFSAAALFLYQSVFDLIGYAAGNIMSTEIITGLSAVGNVLIFGVGVNLLLRGVLGEHKLRVGNMLPALAVAVIYAVAAQAIK